MIFPNCFSEIKYRSVCLFLSKLLLGTLGYANKKLTHIGRRVENETSAVRSHESSGYGHGETKLPKKNGEGSRKNSPNWTYLRSIRIDSPQSKSVIGIAGSNFSMVDYESMDYAKWF